jgi:hypothetical protein
MDSSIQIFHKMENAGDIYDFLTCYFWVGFMML